MPSSLWYRTATTLRDFLSDLLNSDLTAASRAQTGAVNRNRFQSAFQMARGGDVDAARDIPALAKSYLSTIKATAGTELEYRRLAAQVQGQVKFLSGIAELEGANKDVLQTLYEQQIVVLTNLGNFLQLEGLTGDQLENLDQTIQDLALDFDGTIASFDTSLTSLEGAIREAELFSYDYLKERLKVAVDLLPSANIPVYLQELIAQAESGITSTIDFIIRSDLSPPMKWLAINSASEHIKSLDFILRNDVDNVTRRIALATGSELRRGIRLLITGDIDTETRRIALASSSELSRLVNVTLTSGRTTSEAVRVLRQIHDGARTFNRELRASVDLSALTAGQAAFVESLGGASSGRITLAGGFTFSPDEAFQSWYASTTQSRISAPMDALRGALGDLRAAVNSDRWARHREAEKQRLIGVVTNAAAAEMQKVSASQAWAANLVAKVEDLEQRTGAQLRLGQGDAVLSINPNGSISYDATHISGGNMGAFGAEFWGVGGLQDYMARANANLSGSFDRLTALRAQVTALGGVPGFAAGGAHSGGWRVVGERGPELEHTGPSRVVSNSDARSMLDNRVLVNEIVALRREVAAFRDQSRQLDLETVKNTQKTAALLKKADTIGPHPERTS